jgi:hypothetical protein
MVDSSSKSMAVPVVAFSVSVVLMYPSSSSILFEKNGVELLLPGVELLLPGVDNDLPESAVAVAGLAGKGLHRGSRYC